MFNVLKIKILYQMKILEYKFQAWIKVFEISKAYSQKWPAKLNRFVRVFRYVTVCGGLLVVVGGVVWGLLKLAQLKPICNPEAAIFTGGSYDQGREEFSRDSLLKKIDSPVSRDTLPAEHPVFEPSRPGGDVEVKEKQKFIPADYFIIVANKADRILYLLQNSTGNWQVFRSFPMGTGAQAGRKKNAGDKRTPEGYYFIIERKEKRELSSIYGPLAYVLDYPNQEDRKEGRTGQGIWIHGTEPDSTPGKTKGCLAIANDHLLQLASFLKDGIGTPVVIVDKAGDADPVQIPDYGEIDIRRETIIAQRKRFNEEFKVLLNGWEQAWESMDISRYKQFYDTLGFSSQGINWKVWEERKIRTFEIYSSIDITIDNIVVMDNSEKSVTLKFLQIYKSDKNAMENGKQIVLENRNGSWKITRELTIPKEELLL